MLANGRSTTKRGTARLTLVKGKRLDSREPSDEGGGPASHRSRGRNVAALPNAFATEASLARALVAGNPAAARALWDRYALLVRRLLQRSLLDDAVDDVVQEAFLRVYRLVDRLREPDKLKSFVVGVTMRVAREELRRRRVRRWLRLSSTGEIPERSDPPTDHAAAEALARLDELLARLDDETRLVFVLRFVEDVPTTDIAETLGCSLATAKRRVKRAREKVGVMAERDPLLRRWAAADDERGDG
ncbi:MAG TPA: sigma-70 family RNA polymerase sigma factor [Polyangiaceae bacterium]|nr:sigma-70 family RNA polymerase sigma factor [Polyangiaceae bacterium]